MDSAAKRMQVQANQNHWKKAITEAEAEIAKLQQVADINEQEFKVRIWVFETCDRYLTCDV